MLRDSSEITVVVSSYYSENGNKRTKIVVPPEDAKNITGSSDPDTGETPVNDKVTIGTNEEKAVFTGFKLNDDKTEIILFFDFTNLEKEEKGMANNVDIKPFQKGVELETTGWSNTPAESHFFSKLQKGATIHCGYSFTLRDISEITLKLSAYDNNGEKESKGKFKIE